MLFLSRSSFQGTKAKVDLRTVLPALNGSWWINKTLWLEKETELCWIYLPPHPGCWLVTTRMIRHFELHLPVTRWGGGLHPRKLTCPCKRGQIQKEMSPSNHFFLDDILPSVGSLLPELQGDTHTHIQNILKAPTVQRTNPFPKASVWRSTLW